MYTSNELEAISVSFDSQMRQLEKDVMSDIIRRISINGEITRAADWQINRLIEMGMLREDIEKSIKHYLKMSDKEIEELFREAAESGYARNDEIYKKAGIKAIPFEENAVLQQLIAAVGKQTAEEMRNISQSLGFAVKNADGSLSFKPVAEYYQDTLDSAINGIANGVFDYNTAIKKAVSEMTKSGLRTVDYASGWSNRVDVAARRAVMTGFAQVTGKINEMNAEKLHTDTFEVTWHGGARPSHQEWQGKWYTREELVSVCELGTVTGLHGANCRHDYFPVIPGISVPTYTAEELEEMNRKENIPVEYNGKKYTKYEALQRQRRLETTMRAQRQQIHLLKVGNADEDDIIAARCRYRGTSQEYKRFSEAMDLPEQRQRVTVDGLGNIGQGKWKLSTEKMAKHRSYNGATWSKIGKRITDEEYVGLLKHAEEKGIKLVSFKNFDGDVQLIHEMIDDAEVIIKDFPKLKEDKTKLQIHNAFNMADDDYAETKGRNKVYINNYAFRDKKLLAEDYKKREQDNWFVKGTDYRSIIRHELGHVVGKSYLISPMKTAQKVLDMRPKEVIKYVKNNLSTYSAEQEKGLEIISEVFSAIYSGVNNGFALKYYKECVKIIKERSDF